MPVDLDEEKAALVILFKTSEFKLHVTKAIDYVSVYTNSIQETLKKLDRFAAIGIRDILNEPYLQGIILIFYLKRAGLFSNLSKNLVSINS
jgi:hypothetical protein